MQKILNVQKIIYIYNNNYVITEEDLSTLFNMDVLRIIKKYKKIFNRGYCFKINKNYLLNKDGIVLVSLIINSFYIVEITEYILDTFNCINKINESNILNKI